MTGNKDKLDEFYTVLKNGLTVEDFLRQHTAIFKFVHSHGFTKDHRLGKKRVTKLSDEVTPVARFVRKCAESGDWISFAMDNSFPDCIVCHQGGRKRGVEVTIAQALEQIRFNPVHSQRL